MIERSSNRQTYIIPGFIGLNVILLQTLIDFSDIPHPAK